MNHTRLKRSWPAYLEAHKSGILNEKVRQALNMLEQCFVCPRDCGVNRQKDEWAVCKSGRYAVVNSFFPHFGEENCLRGWNGSGTIFFNHCNLKCVFCQNHDISQPAAKKAGGQKVSPVELANMMIELQNRGCHNINFVTPEHVVPQIVEALPLAVESGLQVPLVYNTSAFDSLKSLKLMEGLVDIYMPDFKFWDRELSRRYLKAVKYPEAAKAAIREMHRQVGDLRTDERGLAVRGVLVRHLVMPGMIVDSREIFSFLADDISKDTFINIMSQYRPAFNVNENSYPEINRPVSSLELQNTYEQAREAGLRRLD